MHHVAPAIEAVSGVWSAGAGAGAGAGVGAGAGAGFRDDDAATLDLAQR